MAVDKIRVTIKIFAQFRELLKKNKIEMEIENGADIFQVMNSLCSLYNIRDEIFDKNNEIKEWVKILKNGRQIKFLNGIKTKLEQGDEIALFPPVSGG